MFLPSLYNLGSLAVAGITWNQVVVSGPMITLSMSQDNPSLNFRLVDDDQVVPVAPMSDLLTPGTHQPTMNILAQAYIQIVSSPTTARRPRLCATLPSRSFLRYNNSCVGAVMRRQSMSQIIGLPMSRGDSRDMHSRAPMAMATPRVNQSSRTLGLP